MGLKYPLPAVPDTPSLSLAQDPTLRASFSGAVQAQTAQELATTGHLAQVRRERGCCQQRAPQASGARTAVWACRCDATKKVSIKGCSLHQGVMRLPSSRWCLCTQTPPQPGLEKANGVFAVDDGQQRGREGQIN